MAGVNLSTPPDFANGQTSTRQSQISPQANVFPDGATREPDPGGEQQDGPAEGTPGWVPRPKRIACTVCRKRKLRCDGRKPGCGNCMRLGHECTYNEVRKKSGPKRGYVKQLEARLAQVETLLKGQESPETLQKGSSTSDHFHGSLHDAIVNAPDPAPLPSHIEQDIPASLGSAGDTLPNAPPFGDPTADMGAGFPWEMIGLGLEEPLPAQEVIDDLTAIYFERIHPSMPMIHRPRYYASLNLAPAMRPPICLRYIMWAHAAASTTKYESLHPHFYQRARKYLELDQMKGLGEGMVTVAHAQCYNLVGSYEFKLMYFPRAWMSTGQAMRLSMMMGFHRQDGIGLDVKQCIPPARDWTEREERRRTFWIGFCQDRYASAGTGWPMLVDEKDILSNLPSDEESYVNSKPQKCPSLSEVLSGQGAPMLSPFGGVVTLACILGRNLHHLHRPSPNDKDYDLNGEFWKRHRALDNIILNTCLSLPSHLRLPAGVHDSNIVFCNMCIHTSTICLHQAAIFKAEKNDMPNQIAAESKRRCIIAADQITNIMKMISHTDLSLFNPFIAFCLYVAARVFVQYAKSRPEDLTVRSSLQFLVSAMTALKSKNPLTQSFLVQLELDLDGSGLGIDISPGNLPGYPWDTQRGGPQCPKSQCSLGESDNWPAANSYAQPDQTANANCDPLYPRTSTSTPGGTSTRLPSRSKPSTQHSSPAQFNAQDVPTTRQQVSAGSIFNFPTLDSEQVQSLVMEVDGSTEMSGSSDRQQTQSDHPTPRTNPSSNTSFSPHSYDNPSPPKQHQHQQQQHQSQSQSQHSHINPPQLFPQSTSPSSAFLNTTIPIPTSIPGTSSPARSPFSFPAGWDYPMPQPQQQQQQGHQNHQQQQQQGATTGPTTPGVGAISSPGIGTNLLNIPFEDLSWIQNVGVLDWKNWQG